MTIKKTSQQLKTGETLTISTAFPGDAEELTRYTKKVFSETDFLSRYGDEWSTTAEDEVKYLEGYVSSSENFYLVGKIEPEIVASLDFRKIAPNRGKLAHRGEFGISVLKAHQGKGIGSALLETMLRTAARIEDLEQIELSVVTVNERAVGLYLSHGFKIYGTEKNAMKLRDGRYYDFYRMILFRGESELFPALG